MYLKYESSQRGGLHAHGQTCQPFLQAEQLRRMMADKTVFEEHLFAFFESVMCAYFPEPGKNISPPTRPPMEPVPTSISGMTWYMFYESMCDMLTLSHSFVGSFRRNLPVGVTWDPAASKPVKRNWEELTRVIPLESPIEDLQQYLKTTVNTTHAHEHTFTCKKGGRRGDHFDCRMDYDLPLVPTTCLIEDASFAVRRDHGMLPAYVPGLQLAYPANHVMQLTCDVTRWMRHHLLYQDAQRKNDKQVSALIEQSF